MHPPPLCCVPCAVVINPFLFYLLVLHTQLLFTSLIFVLPVQNLSAFEV